MFPKINETQIKIDDAHDGIIYKFDFDTGNYEILDGNLIPIEDKKERIKQWLKFLIKAEFDNVEIYKSTGFGLSLKKYIGKKILPLGLISAEVKEQLQSKIKLNSFIKEVLFVTVTKTKSGLVFSIKIITNGNEELEVSTNV